MSRSEVLQKFRRVKKDDSCRDLVSVVACKYRRWDHANPRRWSYTCH